MRIEDKSGNFSQEQLSELEHFAINDLLSSPIDIELLDVIRICNGPTDYRGRWGGKLIFNDEENQLEEVELFIDLNYYYLKTVDKLKETLAHEYGHHWTGLYHALRGIRVFEEKLPLHYYRLRGLEYDYFYHDYSEGWEKCDKEVIAEDYRILFSPYRQNHDFENVIIPFVHPEQTIRQYIVDIASL